MTRHLFAAPFAGFTILSPKRPYVPTMVQVWKTVRLARIVSEWSYCGRPVRRHKEDLKVQRILRAPQSQTEVLDKLTRLGFRYG